MNVFVFELLTEALAIIRVPHHNNVMSRSFWIRLTGFQGNENSQVFCVNSTSNEQSVLIQKRTNVSVDFALSTQCVSIFTPQSSKKKVCRFGFQLKHVQVNIIQKQLLFSAATIYCVGKRGKITILIAFFPNFVKSPVYYTI